MEKSIGGGGGGGGCTSFARHGLFFHLDNQVIRIFHLKKCLIILKAVMYLIRGRMHFQVERDQSRNYWLVSF